MDTDFGKIQLINEARQQGYREGYLELRHKLGLEPKIAKEDWERYQEAKQTYKWDNSINNFNALIEITKSIVE